MDKLTQICPVCKREMDATWFAPVIPLEQLNFEASACVRCIARAFSAGGTGETRSVEDSQQGTLFRAWPQEGGDANR